MRKIIGNSYTYTIICGDTPTSHANHFEFHLMTILAVERLYAQFLVANQYACILIWLWIGDGAIVESYTAIRWQIPSYFHELAKQNKLKYDSNVFT